jgi:hypothetical protein
MVSSLANAKSAGGGGRSVFRLTRSMVLLVMVLSSPANAEARARMKAAKKNAKRVLGGAIVVVGLVFVAFGCYCCCYRIDFASCEPKINLLEKQEHE